MYTRCPHCTTIFRVTAEQLRTAHGDVGCVTCGQSFSALDSLSDDVTTLIGSPAPAVAGAHDDDAADEAADAQARGEAQGDGDGNDGAARDDTDQPDTGDRADHDNDIDSQTDTARHPAPDSLPDADTGDIAAADSQSLTEDTGPGTPAGPAVAGEDAARPADAADADADVDTDAKIAGDGSPDDLHETTDAVALPEAIAPVAEDEAAEPAQTTTDPADDFPLDSLEFDAPEQTWTRFFVSPDSAATPGDSAFATAMARDGSAAATGGDTDRPAPDDAGASLTDQTADPQEWQGFLAEIDNNATTVTEAVEPDVILGTPAEDGDAAGEAAADDNDDPAREAPIIPPWLTDDADADETSGRTGRYPSRTALGVGAAALILLCGQLIHYNRDQLATHPTAGGLVRQLYALFDAPLYPQWSLDRYQITGTEAVTGRSAPKALDILANVIVGGERPVGLPLVRVVLQDRWSNPVASRVFTPAEYLRDGGAAQATVTPGTALPIELSVVDPGADALGYVVDICLPRRKAGLECQIATDPFK